MYAQGFFLIIKVSIKKLGRSLVWGCLGWGYKDYLFRREDGSDLASEVREEKGTEVAHVSA